MQGLGKVERGDQGRDIDLTSMRSTMPAGGPLQGGPGSNLNMNLYATKKTAAEGMLDVALFLANITHMKTVIEQGAGYRYYAAVLTLISFSLALQIVAGVLIIIIARVEFTLLPSYQRLLNFLNNLTTAIVFVTLVVNIIKSAFGTQPRRDLNVVSNQRRLDYLNNVATGVIFVTTVINFFISFFGSKRTGFFRWLLARLHF
uniref:ninjurin-2-like isoform X1 n=1 Tax=Doryrhamphus excisus TaxID=161450 RepID=UPI0025AEA724|nr:ninjurin-2-like isoform X1 [Doryrhamphus excisus]